MLRRNGYDEGSAGGDVFAPAGNMLRCGCPLGRPCTCEMGARQARSGAATADYACGECVNCRLNVSKAANRRTSSSINNSSGGSGEANKRRCIRYNEYMKSQLYDVVELSADCVFRLRRPDWDVHEKSAFYTKMRQMRLAMRECHAASTAIIETQNKARKKLNRDLLKAKEVLKNLEELKKATPSNARRMAIDYSHVDSDVFDSFSKQLIPAETLLPDLRARLEKVNASITKEEKSIKIVRQYVFDFAANKLQQSVRDFLRHQHWKRVWSDFKADVQLASAVEIQAFYRMIQARGMRSFLAELRHNRRKEQAAKVICRFLQSICVARQADIEKQLRETRKLVQARNMDAIWKLERIASSNLCRLAFFKWREKQRQATAHEQIRTTRSVVTIQRMYRGFRDRLYLKRIRFLKTLSSRVRELVDQFLVSGNFWGFVLEIDADYRRFEHEKQVEEENALTFVSTFLKQRKLEEDQMMQEWFTASAVQSPIVQRLRRTQNTYADSASPSSSSFASSESPASSDNVSWSQALLESPIAADLIALSPKKHKADVFPTDLPAKSIRYALAEGFALEDIVAVLRGLQAQMKDLNDVNLVLKALYQRTPLMTNTWKSERMVRQETHPHQLATHNSNLKVISTSMKSNVKVGAKLNRPKGFHNPTTSAVFSNATKIQEPFITENLVDSIPGGMKASIARIVLIAAMKSFDPDANCGDGAFALCEDCTSNPFESYLKLESPLLKIRREHQVLEAAKPFVQILTENRCWTGYDVLYNVRGVNELVSWTIPRPLAISIYDVIEQIHHQSTRMGKRNIMREMYISPHFNKFLHERQSKAVFASKEEAAVEPTTLSRPPSPAVDDSLKEQIRERLEKDVLKLPIEDVELAAAEVLFKAAFVVCDQLSCASNSNSFDAFLDSLVAFQVYGDSLALRQLIRGRVDIAKKIADEYASVLKVLGVADATDLVVLARAVDSMLDPVLASKVRELLSQVASQITDNNTRRRDSSPMAGVPKKTITTLLEPHGVSRSTAQLSPLIRQGRTAINTLANDEVSKVDIPF